MPEWDALPPIAKLIVQFALASVIIYGVYLVLVKPRKGRGGEYTSPVFVLGSAHDREVEAANAETDEVRHFYEALLESERSQHDTRVGEWRALREEEKARATEADERLRQNTALLRDLATDLKEARLDLARAVALLGNLPPDRRSSSEGIPDV